MKNAVFSVTCLFLAACSSGDSDSVSDWFDSASIGDGFPTSLTVTIAEGETEAIAIENRFSVFAPASAGALGTPTLSGADASPFSVLVNASEPNALGVRTFEFAIQPLIDLDFEQPADANADNSYAFDISYTIGSTSLSASVRADISDIIDLPQIATVQIFGEQEFEGLEGIAQVVDATGDGVPDLVSNLDGDANFSGYLFSGATIAALAPGPYVSTEIEDFGARLNYDPGRSTRSGVHLNDRVTALSSPTGDGTVIWITDYVGQRPTIYRLPLSTADDFSRISGDIDLMSYQGPVQSLSIENIDQGVRVTSDLSGDGVHDLIVTSFDSFAPAFTSFVAFDAMNSPGTVSWGDAIGIGVSSRLFDQSAISIVQLGDTNGDDVVDFAYTLIATDCTSFSSVQRTFLLDGAELAARIALGQNINSDVIEPPLGFPIEMIVPGPIVNLGDLDGDGLATLQFDDVFEIDLDDLYSLPLSTETFAPNTPVNCSPTDQKDLISGPDEDTFSAAATRLGGIVHSGNGTEVGDYDSDGQNDFIRTAQLPDGRTASGIFEVVSGTESDLDAAEPILTIEFLGIVQDGSAYTFSFPHRWESEERLIFQNRFSPSLDGSLENVGQIAIIQESALREAIASGITTVNPIVQ